MTYILWIGTNLMNWHHTPGAAIIFYLEIFVEFVFYLFHGVFHILELILFKKFICFICLCLVRIYLFMFNKYHFSFVHFFYVVLCMCIHIDVYIFMYDSFIYVRVFVLMYFWFLVHTHIHIYINMNLLFYFFIFHFYIWNYCYVNFIISSFGVSCSLYMHMYGIINLYLISHSLVYMYSFYVFWTVWCTHFSGDWNRYG